MGSKETKWIFVQKKQQKENPQNTQNNKTPKVEYPRAANPQIPIFLRIYLHFFFK